MFIIWKKHFIILLNLIIIYYIFKFNYIICFLILPFEFIIILDFIIPKALFNLIIKIPFLFLFLIFNNNKFIIYNNNFIKYINNFYKTYNKLLTFKVKINQKKLILLFYKNSSLNYELYIEYYI